MGRLDCGPGVRGLTLLLWPLLGSAAGLSAQAPADTVRRDTTVVPVRVIPPEEAELVRLPTMPRPDGERLLPPGSRIILPRDSLDFMNAQTVGDVLASVAGVYLWRGGWLGRPELPNYQGRGATSVEYLVDGIPYLPLGADSVAVDPSILPIGFVERVEIEPLPGKVRVHLYLRDHGLLAPWSMLTVSRGQYEQGRYEALLQKRTRSGLGFALGAAYWFSPSFDPNLGDFDAAYGWAEASYVPSARNGFRLRYRLTSPERAAAITGDPSAPDTLALPIDGRRSDLEARLTLRNRPDLLGRRTDLFVARSGWSSDSVNQTVWQFGVAASHRTTRRSVGGSFRYGTRWTRFDIRAQAGWVLTSSLSAELEGVYQEHDDRQTSRWLLARAGARLPLGFSLAGSWRMGQTVDRPAFPADTGQELDDRSVTLAWNTARLGASVGYTLLSDFQPAAFHQFTVVDSFGVLGPTDWLTVSARIAPRQWFTIQGWYSHPFGELPDGVPPHHSLVSAAIRSQFLRTFPSGFFDLKIQMSMESWGTGVLGRQEDGTPVPLDGATFLRGLIQMRFGSFIVYYDRYNVLDTRQTYVPGFRIPLQAAVYGVRWSFHN